MLASMPQAIPSTWQETLRFVASGFTWIIDSQKLLLGFAVTGSTGWEIALKALFILLPSALLLAALWCTMAYRYTLPLRSVRGCCLAAMLMCCRAAAGE